MCVCEGYYTNGQTDSILYHEPVSYIHVPRKRDVTHSIYMYFLIYNR